MNIQVGAARAALLLLVSLVPASRAEDLFGADYSATVEDASIIGVDVLDETSAEFFTKGRRYRVYANATPTRSSADILSSAVTELAPEVRLDCFYRFAHAPLDELATAGLGDPRPLLPPGYAPLSGDLAYFRPPAVDCPARAVNVAPPIVLDATFANSGGERVWVQADRLAEGAPDSRSRITDAAVSWSNGRTAYSITFENPQDAGEARLVALAQAIDPGYVPGCALRLTVLSPLTLPAQGVAVPTVPAAFTPSSEDLVGWLPVADCPGEPKPLATELELSWTYRSSDGQLLEVGLLRGADAPGKVEDPPFVGDGFIRWTRSNGDDLYVYGHPEGGYEPGLAFDTVYAIAKSLDPELVAAAP